MSGKVGQDEAKEAASGQNSDSEDGIEVMRGGGVPLKQRNKGTILRPVKNSTFLPGHSAVDMEEFFTGVSPPAVTSARKITSTPNDGKENKAFCSPILSPIDSPDSSDLGAPPVERFIDSREAAPPSISSREKFFDSDPLPMPERKSSDLRLEKSENLEKLKKMVAEDYDPTSFGWMYDINEQKNA